jgi:hypothetical protein
MADSLDKDGFSTANRLFEMPVYREMAIWGKLSSGSLDDEPMKAIMCWDAYMIGAYAAIITIMGKMYQGLSLAAKQPKGKERMTEGDVIIWELCGEAESCIKTITRKMTPQLRLYLRETRISWVRK